MKHRLLPIALQELTEALNYYDRIEPGLGLRFLEEFEKVIRRIQNFPEAWPICYHDYRKCRMRGFPFSAIYAVRADGIVVIAIAHAKRRPFYWKDR